MPNETFEFPKGFLWGAATSAHQVEGNNKNDWTEWESSPQRVADLVGRNLNPGDYISGEACDHYRRFRSDFDIAKSLGHNAHRFSIEWSRIEPEEGKFNEHEIEHYREVVKALRERGIEPFVTLWHWTLPLWVRDRGGWESPDIAARFALYCKRVAEEFRQDIKFWAVLNEPQYWLWRAYFQGDFPPHKRNFFAAARVHQHLVQAHKAAYRALKAVNQDFSVGVVESTGWFEPHVARFFLQGIRNFLFPSRVRGNFDFFGLNYYRRETLFGKHGAGSISDIGWDIYPDGFYAIAKECYRRFKKPIIVTENGIADANDTKRAAYIRDHILAMRKAMQEGVDVRGYLHWSLLDNFEWDSGFGPRFGLVEVDYKTQERKIRASALEYKKIIETNSATM